MTALRSPADRLRITLIGSVTPSAAPSEPAHAPSADLAEVWLASLLGLIWIALGGLIVAIGYAFGRHHRWGAGGLFWAGQAVIFLPAAYQILAKRGDWRSHLVLLVGIAGIQAALVWAYSPAVFSFGDELQHARTARDILRTHKLFTPNPTLPVSPDFPGLEEVTTAISSMSGLSVYASGRIIASLSHMLVPVFLFGAFRALTRSTRTAAIAALLYTTDPHYSYFDVLWAYGTPAIAFMALVFRNAAMTMREGASRVPIALAFIPMLITHHLTTFAALLLLAALSMSATIGRQRDLAHRLWAVTLLLLALTALYITLFARGTVSYIGAPVESILAAFSIGHATGSTAQQGPAHLAPVWESLVAFLGAGVTLGAGVAGIALTWWSNARRSVQLLGTCALIYLFILAVRLAAPDGSELASRALTYGMMLIVPVMAIAFECLYQPRLGRLAFLLPLAVFGFISVATIVTASPPAWERIPGTVRVAADESGVDARMLAVTQWIADRDWSRKADVACDWDVCSEVGAFSETAPETDATDMYLARTVPQMQAQISKITADYVQTDQRWITEVPPTGTYFAGDPNEHTKPLKKYVLTRFDQSPLIDRIYDDGDIRFYNTYWVWHG